MIDSSAKELRVSQETACQFFKIQEEVIKQMRYDLYQKSNMLSSEYFKRKFKPKISSSDQRFENQEEELIEFKEEHHD